MGREIPFGYRLADLVAPESNIHLVAAGVRDIRTGQAFNDYVAHGVMQVHTVMEDHILDLLNLGIRGRKAFRQDRAGLRFRKGCDIVAPVLAGKRADMQVVRQVDDLGMGSDVHGDRAFDGIACLQGAGCETDGIGSRLCGSIQVRVGIGRDFHAVGRLDADAVADSSLSGTDGLVFAIEVIRADNNTDIFIPGNGRGFREVHASDGYRASGICSGCRDFQADDRQFLSENGKRFTLVGSCLF